MTTTQDAREDGGLTRVESDIVCPVREVTEIRADIRDLRAAVDRNFAGPSERFCRSIIIAIIAAVLVGS